MSVCQWRLSALPHSGCRSRLMWVICFHWPMGPAHTSGGWVKDWRTVAAILPSRESETPTPKPFEPRRSAPVYKVEMAPESKFTEATPLLPSTISQKTMCCESADHSIELGVAFILGVMSRAWLVWLGAFAGTV